MCGPYVEELPYKPSQRIAPPPTRRQRVAKKVKAVVKKVVKATRRKSK